MAVVDRHDRVEDFEIVVVFAGGFGQCLHVFGEAGAAVAYAGKEEALADAGVAAHAHAHHVHIGAHALAEVGDFVHKSDAGG